MNIIFLCLGSRGDVQPYVAIGKAAKSQGHQVTICTGKSFEKLIKENELLFEECSLDFMQILQTQEGKAVFEQGMKHPLKALRYAKDVINPLYRKAMTEFYNACKNKDVIVFHPKALGAVDIAEKLKILCISMPTIPIIYPISEFPNLAITTRSLGGGLNKLTYIVSNMGAESGYLKEINDFRKSELYLASRKSGEYMIQRNGKQLPIIYPISDSLFADTKEFENRVVLSGFPVLDEDSQLDEETVSFIRSGKKPLIITFSSMPLKDSKAFLDKIRSALNLTGDRAIILVGNSGIEMDSSDQILVKNYISHERIFREGKGILHHGGVGTMAAALRSGVPQVMMPFNVDQPFWAKRLYSLGYALKPLHENDSETEFASRFLEMDRSEIISNAKKISQIVKNEDSNQKAVTCIENLYRQWENENE